MVLLIDIYNEEMDECPESYTFDYDAEAGTITVPQDVFIMENAQPERNYNDAYGYYIQPVLHKGEPTVEEVVELPEGLTADEYHMQAVDGYFNTEHVGTVYVATLSAKGMGKGCAAGWYNYRRGWSVPGSS